MSGTADPTHVYWDLENRKGLWARGEAMNSIDSKIPQMPEVRIARLEEELLTAEAEVARLRGLILEYEVNSPGCQSNLLAEARRILAPEVK
jgi:hypothetical protein